MNFRILQLQSLKTRVTFFTLAIFLIGLWSLAFYASRMLREDMQRLLGEQQFSAVSILAAEVNQELEDRLKALETVAGSMTPAMLGHAPAMQALLTQNAVFQAFFSGGIFVVQRDGTVMASMPLSTGRFGVNFMDRDYIATALQDGKSALSKPALGKVIQAPMFAMATPIRDPQGKVIGALAGVVDLSKPNFLDRITNSNYGKSGVYLIAAPQHNLFVTASDKSRIMRPLPAPGLNPMHDKYAKGYEGYGTLVNFRGEEELTAAKGIPVVGWFMAIALPAAEAFAPIRAMQQRMLWATFLLTLLAGVLTWWMLRRQLSPLLAAVKTLATLSNTKENPQPLPITTQDEIGELIGGFNRLLETLGQREAVLRQILDTSSVAIFLVDKTGRIAQANQCMAEMFGWSLDALEGREYVALVHPAERELGRQKMLALLASAVTSVDLERLYWRADQSEFCGHLTGRRFYDANGEAQGLVGVIADITERKQAEEKLHLAASVFTHAREGIMITTADGTIIEVNDAFSRITGYSRDEALGNNPRILSSGRHSTEFYAAMWGALVEKGHWYGEIWNRRKNGEVYVEMQTISAVRDAQDNALQYVALSTDITALKAYQSQLEHIAHYDALTSLPNRVLLGDRLHQAIAQTQRRGQRLAVAYLDLDGFKAINDRHGHEAGDQLLIALAARMKESLREGDTLARMGGDEFVAVLLDLSEVADSVPMLNRLLAAAAQPVHFGEAVLQVSASLGVTFFPQAEDADADQLLRQADQAMYQAKQAGRNRYHVFDAEQDRSVRGHHESVERIRKGLTEHEFVLYYQPKVNMRKGTVIGVEALIRWQHPDKGLLAPAMFLPVIETHPLAIELGEWVIDTALRQMTQWQADGLAIPVSVNIGARQLQQADFAERLRQILVAHPKVRPGDLELEVLETSALEDLVHVSQVIQACREIGVTFALDDFGTGYSSLTYLKRLPVTKLKIDQSFVRDMLDDPDDLAILEGVIGLASAFRRQVIAEGVETVEHGTMLLQLGCDFAQGYGIARPMPVSELPGWTQAWRTDPAWVNQPCVSRDDLPLLFASAEHRAWILAIDACLKGTCETRPPLDIHQCRFGTWLASEGLARHGAQPVYTVIDSLHRQAHTLAEELLALQAQGKNQEALQRLGELHGLRDALLEQLQALVQLGRR